MSLVERVAELLGESIDRAEPVAGGDICSAYRLHVADGRRVFVKTHQDPPPGLFPVEADGLRWLAAAGPEAVPVPNVLAAEPDLLAMEWVEPAGPTQRAAVEFGRRLARLHRTGAGQYGSDTPDTLGFAGALPLDNTSTSSWPEFYAERRIGPLLERAVRVGALDEEEAAPVRQVLDRLGELAGPDEPPARLHGDLWAGNLLWGADGQVHLVDPAAYGGHRESDLAMLALFGAPWLEEIIAAYDAEHPLAAGWRERVALHQLCPLLVHAVLFGGGYAGQVVRAARTALSTGTARS